MVTSGISFESILAQTMTKNIVDTGVLSNLWIIRDREVRRKGNKLREEAKFCETPPSKLLKQSIVPPIKA